MASDLLSFSSRAYLAASGLHTIFSLAKWYKQLLERPCRTGGFCGCRLRKAHPLPGPPKARLGLSKQTRLVFVTKVPENTRVNVVTQREPIRAPWLQLHYVLEVVPVHCVDGCAIPADLSGRVVALIAVPIGEGRRKCRPPMLRCLGTSNPATQNLSEAHPLSPTMYPEKPSIGKSTARRRGRLWSGARVQNDRLASELFECRK